MLRKAVTEFKKPLGEGHPTLAALLTLLAQNHFDAGLSNAREILNEAVDSFNVVPSVAKINEKTG